MAKPHAVRIPLHLELVLFTGAAYYWVRLPFQPLAIWWALYASGLVQWPPAIGALMPGRTLYLSPVA